jgi:hypothetical protein
VRSVGRAAALHDVSVIDMAQLDAARDAASDIALRVPTATHVNAVTHALLSMCTRARATAHVRWWR